MAKANQNFSAYQETQPIDSNPSSPSDSGKFLHLPISFRVYSSSKALIFLPLIDLLYKKNLIFLCS